VTVVAGNYPIWAWLLQRPTLLSRVGGGQRRPAAIAGTGRFWHCSPEQQRI